MTELRDIMMRTTYRQKLPRGLSYPIGAELLTELLVDVPHVETFDLYFTRHEHIFVSDYQSAIRSAEPVTMVAISYQNMRPGLTGSNYMIEQGWYGEHWKLSVFAVPSHFRLAARNAVITAAGRIRSWLMQSRPDTWKDIAHALRVKLRFDDPEPIVEEE